MEPVEKTIKLEKSDPADKKVKELTTNSCWQNCPKIAVKELNVLKSCNLEICSFVKNGVLLANYSGY